MSSDTEKAAEVSSILLGHKQCQDCKKYIPPERMEAPFFSGDKDLFCKECYAKIYGCSIEPSEPWPRG